MMIIIAYLNTFLCTEYCSKCLTCIDLSRELHKKNSSSQISITLITYYILGTIVFFFLSIITSTFYFVYVHIFMIHISTCLLLFDTHSSSFGHTFLAFNKIQFVILFHLSSQFLYLFYPG